MANVQIIGIQGEERNKGAENLFKERKVKTFQIWGNKDTKREKNYRLMSLANIDARNPQQNTRKPN
jgi:hypothetical protein